MRRWALTVGIDQYQFLQPLSYAQQDAQGLRDFLVHEANFAPEQSLLLSDASAPNWGQSTIPDRQTIQRWLDLLCHQYVQPGDLLWVFFSGYGVCQRGRDYLVPIDGNPADLDGTAIPLEYLFNRIQATSANAVVLLDINRSQSSLPNETIGAQTVYLAGYFKVPTILSCQPGQFSHETAELQHGFFTAALLEALRYQRYPTLAGLHQHLSRRLPELTEHFLRPVQQPLIVSPPDRLYQVILPQPSGAGVAGTLARPDLTQLGGDHVNPFLRVSPQQAIALPLVSSLASASFPTQATNGNGVISSVAGLYQPSSSGATGYPPPATPGVDSTSGGFATSTSAQMAPSEYSNGQIPSSGEPHQVAPANGAAPPNPPSPPVSEGNDEEAATELDVTGLRSPLLWGSLVAATLLMGVLGRNWNAIAPASVPLSSATITNPAVSGATKPVPPNGQSASPISVKTDTSKQAGAATTQPLAPPVNHSGAKASHGSGQVASSPNSAISATAHPNSVNHKSNPAERSRPLQQDPNLQLKTGSNGRIVLTASREQALIRSDQASPFWYAIQGAKKVPPGSPDYVAAQQNITNWSQDIWVIATRRANQRSFDAAIMAAALVPREQSIYASVQKTVPGWCSSLTKQSVRNSGQRRQAKGICHQLTASKR